MRRDLATHYSSISHHERVGLDLNIPRRFERLAAGMLSAAELRATQTGAWNGSTSDVAAVRAFEIAQDLAHRQGAVDLLPNITQHHAFNYKVMELSRERARDMIALIDTLIEGSAH